MSRIENLLAIDLRSLAAFRVSLGSFLLADVVYRALDLSAHYTDAGILPRALYHDAFGAVRGAWSLHLMGGSFAFQALLFGLLGIAALALLAGFRPRIAALAAWVLLLSLQNRQPLITTGADIALRMLVFWAVLLPLPRRHWRRQTATPEAHGRVLSCASSALLIQVALIYLFSVVFKLRDPSWVELTAVEQSLRVSGVATQLGEWLLGWPAFLSMLTAATLFVEVLAPLLAFVPWKTGPIRTVLVFGMIAFHCLGIGAVMNLGLFEYVMAAAWIPFLPSWFWDRVGQKGPGAEMGRATGARRIRSGRVVNVAALMALALVVAGNIDSLRSVGPHGVGWALVRVPTRVLGLSQSWKLWSTPMQDRYYVFPACLGDGSRVDLHTGRPLDWNRPRRTSRNNHWWKYHHLVSSHPVGRKVIPGYASYLIRDWDEEHPERPVVSLQLFRLDADAPGQLPAQLPRRLLFELVVTPGGPCADPPSAESGMGSGS